jgi:DinB superfamily
MPTLDPPGAGLPRLELMVVKLLLGWQQRRTTRGQAAKLFAREREVVVRLASRCDPESGSRPVLIDRLRGMEDNSRFWSVFMVIDHLRIVNGGISEVIRLLGRGQTPERQLRIADVKPSPQANQEVTGEFEQVCVLFERRAAALPDLRTAHRYAHPWFGLLDAAGWHFLAGFHMQLHRRQIEQILRHLSRDRS